MGGYWVVLAGLLLVGCGTASPTCDQEKQQIEKQYGHEPDEDDGLYFIYVTDAGAADYYTLTPTTSGCQVAHKRDGTNDLPN